MHGPVTTVIQQIPTVSELEQALYCNRLEYSLIRELLRLSRRAQIHRDRLQSEPASSSVEGSQAHV